MRLTERVHRYLEECVNAGDQVIDATAGNGHDALKLAELVGPEGKVIAIDLQAEAIGATGVRLESAGLLDRSELIQGDHREVLQELEASHRQRIAAITFNLGYLPGSDKQIQTSPTSTLPALDSAWRLLQPGGRLLVTAYRGHPGGLDEAERVAEWMQENCPQAQRHEPEVRGERIPPILWAAECSKAD